MRYFWLWRFFGFELIAAITHWSVRRSYFQAEDFLWLHLSSWQSLLDSFRGTWGYGTAYRPITRLSYWLNLATFGHWAPGWHFTNVALHGLNAALLAYLLERLGARRSVATGGAVLFTVLPLTAECVAFISDRTAILCLLFMLLASLAWLSALARPTAAAIAAMVVLALLGAASYEAGFVLPGLLVVLLPLALRQTGAEATRAGWLIAVATGALALLFLVRHYLVGLATIDLDDQYPDALTAIIQNGPAVLGLFAQDIGLFALAWIAVMTIAALAQARLRLAVLALLAAAVLFYLPFLILVGLGDRFFYMSMAPLAILPVIAANNLGRVGRNAMVLVSVGLLFPIFFQHSRADSIAWTDAGRRTALLERNLLGDLPNDGVPNIIDDVPPALDSRPMFGGFFSMALRDAVSPAGPWVILDTDARTHPITIYDLLNRQTRFWRLDPASLHLVELGKQEWLDRHPEVPALIESVGVAGSAKARRSPDCETADKAASAQSPAEDGPPDPEITMAVATLTGDGVITLPLGSGYSVFSVAVENHKAVPQPIEVFPMPGQAGIPIRLSICETEMATGACLEKTVPKETMEIAAHTIRTFAVRVSACDEIPPDRSHNRILVDVADRAGKIARSMSVAVQTIPRNVSN